jgi:hypothetical protein
MPEKMMQGANSFQELLKTELDKFIQEQESKYPKEDVLKADLHCHDFNSDKPDELLGRILNVPETWLPTEKLIHTLERNKVDVITITNHNNARSCFELIEKGMDILVGAEFSCMVPDYNIGIHVLAYGFSKEAETELNRLRKNAYLFQKFAKANDIPTIWAHPLYHYSAHSVPSIEFFNKMALIFERFEVLNGQRDTWQNLLVKFWVDGLTPDKIDAYANTFNLDPNDYCTNPYLKSISGGSDSHMGIFTGQTGSYLYVPGLKENLKTQKASKLALQAIKTGRMAPYGSHQNAEKLTVAFLDYVCQIALYKKDPGLMRIMLHKGTYKDKLLALFITNAFAELRRHKVTTRFMELFHNCFMGKAPASIKKIMVPKVYKPIFKEATKIAHTHTLPPHEMVKQIELSVNNICDQLNHILFSRLDQKINNLNKIPKNQAPDINEIIEKMEFPADLRTLISGNGRAKKKKRAFTFQHKRFPGWTAFPVFGHRGNCWGQLHKQQGFVQHEATVEAVFEGNRPFGTP